MPRPTRRTFLKTVMVGGAVAGVAPAFDAGAAVPAAAVLPNVSVVDRRPLGKVGAEVSILGLGLGSAFTNANKTAEAAAQLLEHAIAKGINYWDTCRGYGKSEELIGPTVARHRDSIFLVTKNGGRDYDAFMRDFETSLQMLQTDRVDLCHIWNLKRDEDLARIEQGALKAVRKLKEDKTIGAFGITGHSGAAILEQAIARFDPDALLTVLPCTRPDNGRYEDTLLPMARERDMGVIAMKTVRQARNADLKGTDLIRYALSLDGVRCAIVGADTIAHLDENAAMATTFKALPREERLALHQTATVRLAGTTPPWDMPGYDDGRWA